MKTHSLTAVLFTALLAGCLPARVGAQGTLLQLNVTMSNVRWTPAAGSLIWASDWRLQSAASVFDPVNGHRNAYQEAAGASSAAEARASTAMITAWAKGTTDAAGNIIALQSSVRATIPANTPQGILPTAFCAASAYREFSISGGSGPVAVTFRFDYSGYFRMAGDDSLRALVLEYLVTLRVSNGSRQWELTAFDRQTSPATNSFSGTISGTFDLQSDTRYSMTLLKDLERAPEPGSARLLTLGLGLFFLGRAAVARRAASRTGGGTKAA